MKQSKKDDIRFNRLSKAAQMQKLLCSHCGNKVTVPFFMDRKICPACGYYVYRNKNLEFKENLKRKGVKVDVRKDQEKKYREA